MESNFDLTGRVALVTGGGRGLGRGMAIGLARAGAAVVVSSRSAAQLDESVAAIEGAGGVATAIECDVATADAPARLVSDALAAHGRLDVLVHAAGNQVRTPALEFAVDDWDAVQGLHLRAAFLLAQAAGRHMVERGSGSIVFVGSLTSARAGLPDVVAYAAAKSGLLGLARTLAVEWAPSAVRVNTILAGFFPTEMTADLERHPGRQALMARAPMGRLGTPEDLAGPVVFLAADASAYVTGACLTVDGGWSVA